MLILCILNEISTFIEKQVETNKSYKLNQLVNEYLFTIFNITEWKN